MKELIKIQQELHSPKSGYNAFGKYAFRSAEGILSAVKPLLAETSCLIHQTDEIVLIGVRYYVKAVATIINSEGQAVSATGYAREEDELKGMHAGQITGATSSYSRKYALQGLLAISEEKDLDSEAPKDKTKKPEVKITPANGTGNYTAGNTSAITVAMDTPLTPAVANKKTVEKKLPWLNPTDTKNWDYTVKRVSEGVPVETIEGVFRLSKENRELLIKEASLKTVANAN